MSLKTIFNADVAAIEPEVPAQMRLGGVQGAIVTGSAASVADSLEMEDAGFLQRYGVEFIARVAAFKDLSLRVPKVRDEVEVYDDAKAVWLKLKVKSVNSSADGVTLIFNLTQSI